MRRLTGFVLVGALAIYYAPSASAQRAEASFNFGYSASEGIEISDRLLLGQIYDTLAVDSGASINLTFGYFFTDQFSAEFLWGRQNSRFQADGPAGKLEISELTLYNYMFNGVYSWGERDAQVRPYAFAGLGWTSYSFGDLLLPAPTPSASGQIDNESRFSTNLGAGVKFYFTPNVGAKFGFRWTPTYIKSETEGFWCDPFYGCWELVDTDYSNQFETAVGLTVRF